MRHATVLSLLLTSGCVEWSIEREARLINADGVINECEPTIGIPTNVFNLGVSPEVEPHADRFGTEAPDPFAVHLGWPSSDPSTSISFVWRTDVDTMASAVELWSREDRVMRFEGASFRFGGPRDTQGEHRVHEFKICSGLQPDTEYHYRVGGEGHWSEIRSFRTPPPPGTFDSFRVAFMGDSREGYEIWGEVARQADAHDPDFFVFTGDMVQTGSMQDEWDEWFTQAEEVLSRKVVVPAHGNHELLAVHYFANWSLPNNEQWFHYRYGDLVLVSLNDTVHEMAHRETDQVEYLDQVWGQAPSDAWKISTHHHSIYASCSRHGSAYRLRAQWEPTYDQHQPQMVVAGHNHTYERSVPIRDGVAASPGEGTIYLVTGGAGAPLYRGQDESWFNEVFNATEHYVIADFGPDQIDVVVRDLTGQVIDSFVVPRS
ncbi:MAG: metallophosphoesterase family protein [Deltaproteobacteria bacterium]|nr:MAG: metallophosphoesterase family protein [Deltaproteobacteria bacterium]